MDKKTKLKKGDTITINVPFTYEVGQEPNFTGGKESLDTLEDMFQEVRNEIDDQIDGSNIYLEAEVEGKIISDPS